jgi:hypothetical protein
MTTVATPSGGGGGGGSEEDSEDPYTEQQEDATADYSSGVHNRPPKKPPAGPEKKPPGAPYTPSGGGGGGGSNNYDLSGYTAGAIAEAEQEANDFAGWLGWPSWFDYNAQVKSLLQAGLNADANQAYEFLWTQLSKTQQKDNQNAYFGLTKQQYTEKLNQLTDMYQMYTGDTAVPDALRNKALRENWTQSELQAALEKDPTVGATAPWIAAGQTFRDVSSQFASQYGMAAKDKTQLGSWWKFRSGAQSVGTGGPAQIAAQQPATLVQRMPAADVQTR